VASDLPDGYRIKRLDDTVSTNADCLEAAKAGEASGLWIMARRQSGGRGSRGRSWVSQEGNLFASLMLREPAPANVFAELTFVASLAVRDAIARLARQQGVSRTVALKWPNDVLVSGRKISGILLESHEAGGERVVIIGIGVNCISHPEETLLRATDLAAEGIQAGTEEVLVEISASLSNYLTTWNRGEGFEAIRQAWLDEATGIGQRIYVKMPGRELTGTFEDLAPDGNLVLTLDDGSAVRLSAADIFFANQS
jgi:BirA family transcriptional regulator, biotin operon repressor / biotin---[acetyl-CoA-carboxylase] ligase